MFRGVYRETTDGIQIDVMPAFLPEHSKPELGQYVFGYQVRISNVGDRPARLVNRHWIITDGKGEVHEVKGPGVVGATPRIEPGQVHEYTSFCPLPTPTGNMRGTYEMARDDGTTFHATIPLFFLRDLGGTPGEGGARSRMVH